MKQPFDQGVLAAPTEYGAHPPKESAVYRSSSLTNNERSRPSAEPSLFMSAR